MTLPFKHIGALLEGRYEGVRLDTTGTTIRVSNAPEDTGLNRTYTVDEWRRLKRYHEEQQMEDFIRRIAREVAMQVFQEMKASE